MNQPFDCLDRLRRSSGAPYTTGLSDELIAEHIAEDPDLTTATNVAIESLERLPRSLRKLLESSEEEVLDKLQESVLSFYRPEYRTPFVPLAAKGPWIVTAYGAVVFDVGGYGMLGFGHAPPPIVDALARPYVMANVMTPQFRHKCFTDLLLEEIGHTRGTGSQRCFDRFLFLNSGSEAISLAVRIIDARTRSILPTDKRPVFLSLRDSFHGRTYRAAQLSHSTQKAYGQLASFAHRKEGRSLFVPPNDIAALEETFTRASEDGLFIEAVFLEPVQGEGNAGLAIEPAFYEAARALTREHGSILVVDSIQAGLRTHGVLSVVDYPGFGALDPPDIEAFSKALNAGQYPLSVLAVSDEVVESCPYGIYGNTMTANPRALAVGCEVMEAINDDLRRNIVARGQQLLDELRKLKDAAPEDIEGAQGTGLIVSMKMNPRRHQVTGADGLEKKLRRAGLNVIHSGDYSVRFTPHFNITARQVELIARLLEDGIRADRTTPG